MLDIIIEEIIDYIEEDLGGEKRKLKRLVDYINFDLKRLYPPKRKKYHEALSEEIQKFSELIENLKEIRKVFQKGKPFAHNQTKGKKKNFTLLRRYLHTIEFLIKRNRIEEAIEEAKRNAESLRKFHSERSYYRFKNKLKELNIEI